MFWFGYGFDTTVAVQPGVVCNQLQLTRVSQAAQPYNFFLLVSDESPPGDDPYSEVTSQDPHPWTAVHTFSVIVIAITTVGLGAYIIVQSGVIKKCSKTKFDPSKIKVRDAIDAHHKKTDLKV